jgi:catechol 2,3-dioxygenase-like lactoylglutathione lyase family enzyme
MTVLALEGGIVTADAAQLVAFYRDAFEFDLQLTHATTVGTLYKLRRGHAWLKLFQPAAVTGSPQPMEPWYALAGMRYVALYVADARAAFARAKDAGASVLLEPTSHRPGAIASLVRDPQGNVIELLQDEEVLKTLTLTRPDGPAVSRVGSRPSRSNRARS